MVNSPNFTPKFIEDLCDWIAEGKSVRSFCRANEAYKPSTICSWLVQDEAFAEQYTRAMEMRGDAKFEDIDDFIEDLKTGKQDAATTRVLIDAVKWQAGKLKPKKYGDSTTLKGDKDHPLGSFTLASLFNEISQSATDLPSNAAIFEESNMATE